MLPELFKIPSLNLTVWSYGFILGLGAIAGLWLTWRLAEHDGLSRDELLSAVLWCGPVVFVGSQLLTLVAAGWPLNWHEILSPNRLHSGGTYYGALLTVLPASILLTHLMHLPWLQSLDTCTPGIALVSAVGRLGCFAAGCCWGRPTNSWLGVRFTERTHALTGVPADVALVPTQLLLAGAGLIILAAVFWLRQRQAFAGQIILAYLILYSGARFVIEFWRDDPRGQLFGLSTSQVIAMVILPLAVVSYCRAWPTKRMGFSG